MELTLDDFNEPTLTLDDFEGMPRSRVNLHHRTAMNSAATNALLTGGTPEQFDADVARVANGETRGDYLAQQEAIRKAIVQDSLGERFNALADPTLPDDTRAILLDDKAFENFTIRRGVADTMQLLAESAALAEPSETETAAAAASRFNAVDTINNVIEHKRRLQEVVNGLREELRPSAGSALTDVAEMWLPFAEWIHWDQLERDLSGREGVDFSLMGTQKQRIFDYFKGLPPEKVELLLTDLVDIIRDNENVLLPDGNDLLTLEAIENTLTAGDYSDAWRIFDNVISLTEIIGVGVLVKNTVRSARMSKLAEAEARLAKEAEAFKATPDPTAEDVFGETPTLPRSEEPTVEGVFGPQTLPEKVTNPAEERLLKEAESFIPSKEPDVDEVFRQGTAEAVRTEVDPASTSQILKDTNPDQARAVHDMLDGPRGEEVAQATYGTSRTEAIANDVLPNPGTNPSLPHKPEMKKPPTPEPEIIRLRRMEDGNIIYNDVELGRAVNRLTAGLENVEGMLVHPSSMIVRTNIDGTFGISARYSPVDNGFSTPSQALDNAEYAFRNYGFPRESFKLVEKQGDEWVEITQKDALAKQVLQEAGAEFAPSEYAIKLDVDYRLRPEDVSEYDLLTKPTGLWSQAQNSLSHNPLSDFFVKVGQGSIAQNIFDPASLLPAQLVNAASVRVDKAYGLQKAYVSLFEELAEEYGKLPRNEQALVADYIHLANRAGIPMTVADLVGRGMNDKQIDIIKKWRAANDIMWYAANGDMVKTLRERGHKVLVHKDSDTKLIGRPISMQSKGPRTDVYDPRTNEIKKLSDTNVQAWEGGQLIELDQPIELNGKWVQHAISHENVEGGYLRTLWDDEVVLNYRDGYYPVMYDANYFLYKKVKLGDGTTVNKVIASARDRGEIKRLREQIKASENLDDAQYDELYDFRRDRRDAQSRNQIFDEGAWGIASNSGLTSQRIRGKMLQDAGVDLHKSGFAHLKDPMEAVAEQIRQMSQRVSMRDYSTAFKRRWMTLYGKYYDLPINPQTGKIDFPTSIDHLKPKNGAPRSMVADGKTQFNYIMALENGYINGIDEMTKRLFHGAANIFAELGLFKLERGANIAARVSPTQEAKTAAFKMFISLNPARQAIIQRGQLLQLMAINPSYTSTKLANDLMRLNVARWTRKGSPDTMKLLKEVEDSGIFEAVDAHTLLRHDMLHLADRTMGQKVASTAHKPIEWSQKVGFDWAEQDILLSSYLAHRDLWIKSGKKVKSIRDIETILGQSRAFTLNMNRSGDMAYSQNTLSVIMQFFSFRHKALLATVTNKALSPMDRSKLFATNLLMFGPDALIIGGLVNYWFDSTEPSPEKDYIKDGLVDLMLNGMLTMASGEKQSIDFGDLAPTEAIGMWSTIEGLLGSSLIDMVATSPAGSLVMGNSPRVSDAITTAARYFVPPWNYDDPELTVKPADVVNAFMHLASGYSNGFKANYAFHNGKMMSSSGRFSDQDVTKVEAAARVLGFRTKDEEGTRKMYEALYGRGDSSTIFTNEDVELHYQELKRHLARRNIPASELAAQQAILREAHHVFNLDRPRYLETLRSLIARDARAGDYTVLTGLVNQMGLKTEEEMLKAINKLPNNELREHAMKSLELFQEYMYNDPIRE